MNNLLEVVVIADSFAEFLKKNLWELLLAVVILVGFGLLYLLICLVVIIVEKVKEKQKEQHEKIIKDYWKKKEKEKINGNQGN